MASHSLTTKDRLHDSIKLATFLKILAHIKIEERDDYFEEVSTLFKTKDKKYVPMLNYYKNTWLKTYYVESMVISTEENQSLITRTNNVCETYNHLLNMRVAITSPRLSILITKLIEEEYCIREYVMKSTVDVSIKSPIPQDFAVSENELPIESLGKLLEEKR